MGLDTPEDYDLDMRGSLDSGLRTVSRGGPEKMRGMGDGSARPHGGGN
jgi:hypothetical protein